MTICPVCGWKHSSPVAECEGCGATEGASRARFTPSRRRLALGALAAGVATAGLLVAGKKGALPEVPGLTAPSESNEGETWAHKDLVEHLGKKGVKLEIDYGGAPLPNGAIVSYVVPPEVPPRDRLNQSIFIYLCKDRQSAREMAGAGNLYQWGRFVLPADGSNPQTDSLAKQVKAALGK